MRVTLQEPESWHMCIGMSGAMAAQDQVVIGSHGVCVGDVGDVRRSAGAHWRQLESCRKKGKNVVYYRKQLKPYTC